jgi:hypothetical protein
VPPTAAEVLEDLIADAQAVEPFDTFTEWAENTMSYGPSDDGRKAFLAGVSAYADWEASRAVLRDLRIFLGDDAYGDFAEAV